MESQNQPPQEINNTHHTQLMKYISSGIVLFLVGILIGGFTTYFFQQKSINNAYQNGFNSAKKLVENSPLGAGLKTPSNIHTLSGAVTAINGHNLTIHVPSINPFAEPSLASRIVLINSSTTIAKIVQKDPKVFQAEIKVFEKTASSTSTPPWQFKSVSATIADITVGDTVIVTSVQNIKTLKDFTVSRIQIYKKITTHK